MSLSVSFYIKLSLLLAIKATAFLSMGTIPIVPCIFFFLWEQFILDMFSSVLLETGFCYAPWLTGTHCAVQAGFEHAICLSRSPECWDYRHAPSCPVSWFECEIAHTSSCV